jgi:hypothetical protein
VVRKELRDRPSVSTRQVSGDDLWDNTAVVKKLPVQYLPPDTDVLNISLVGKWLKTFMMSTRRSLWIFTKGTLMELSRCSTEPISFFPGLDATFLEHVVTAFNDPLAVAGSENRNMAEALQTRLQEIGITMRVYTEVGRESVYTLVV